jgi:hypothetical protein
VTPSKEGESRISQQSAGETHAKNKGNPREPEDTASSLHPVPLDILILTVILIPILILILAILVILTLV